MADNRGRSTSFLGRFTVLKGAVRELWIVFAAKVLAILAYCLTGAATLGLWLSAGYSTLSTVDLKDLPAMATRLKQPSPADGVSRYLSDQLSATNRNLLTKFAGGADARLQQALVEQLNQLIQNNSIYEVQRFAGVKLSAETQSLLGEKLQGGRLAHLNRLLLEDAYPVEIAKPTASGLGYSDTHAGYLVAIWSTVMTFFTILVGSLVDAIGLRKAFLLGFGICLFSRGMMTFTTAPWLALPFGLFVLALGEALMTPVMVAAVKRYSTTVQRSISFAIFYAMMNVGFLIAGLVFDYVRKGLGEYGHFTVPLLGVSLSTYRTLFLLSFLFTFPNLVLMYFGLRDGVEATDAGVKIMPEQPKYIQASLGKAFGLMIRDALRDTGRIFAGLWRQPTFYRFLAFLSLVVAVRLISYHMNYTYPKFGIRELGPAAAVGRLWAVNQALIIVLVPIVGALTQRIAAYPMVMVGSFISALSVCLMALPPQLFQSLADGWPGHLIGHVWLGVQGNVHPYYVLIFLYVVFLSLGEALWSPRLYEYPAAIAPRGQEASYMSLSFLPFFVAKLFVGASSGLLLDKYCPEAGPRDSQTLWLIIALPTLITPLGLLVLRRYIRVREAGRES